MSRKGRRRRLHNLSLCKSEYEKMSKPAILMVTGMPAKKCGYTGGEGV
jgi:hypothetical protein